MSSLPTQSTEPNGLGGTLRRAREAAGLSQGDLARQLNLAARTVEALEQEDLAALPSAVYVQGYLRKWAEYLQLDEAQLQQAYARLKGTQVKNDMRHVTPIEPMRIKKTSTGFPWAKLLVFLLMVGLGLASTRFLPESMRWLDAMPEKTPDRALTPDTHLQPLPVLPSIPLVPHVSAPPPAPSIAVSMPGIIVGEVIGQPSSPSPVTVAPEAPPQADTGLELYGQGHEQGSWVRVKDAKGGILFEGVLMPGSKKQLKGERPFELTIGRASDLAVKLDGNAVDLSLYGRPGGKAFIPRLGASIAQ